MMERCDVCKEWGTETLHIHQEEEIEGLLENLDIKRSDLTKDTELEELEDGSIVYRYLLHENDLSLINSSQLLASRAMCMCRECLKYSLSFVPHYGDGAYCTHNNYLKTEHPRIMHSHGIDIRAMDYRAIIKIKDSNLFKKIDRTAGVIKSVPEGKELMVEDLVFTDEDSIKIIGFQKWTGNGWEDILLEDLKGVC